jgi:hypothetical protein
MNRIIHIAPSNRVIMDISDLLLHHLAGMNLLGMHPLLPYLITPIIFVPDLIETIVPKETIGPALNQSIDDCTGSIGLEGSDLSRYIG